MIVWRCYSGTGEARRRLHAIFQQLLHGTLVCTYSYRIREKPQMSQLKAFLHKAWIVKKRHPGALFLEIVLPLVFIGLSAVIARFIIRVEIDEVPETIK